MGKKRNVPEIRFAGFTDDWEQRKLGEIGANFYGGGTPNTAIDNFWNGHLAWLQSSDISEFDVLHSNPKKFITLKGLQNSAAKKIPSKSIAIVTRVGVGKVLLVPFEYSTSQDFLSISELKIDELFAIYAISKLMNIEKDNVQGTSIKGITKNELLDKSIFIPKDKTEQTAIGNFFKQLDETIALHQREYEKYKNLKISYLEKMFPKENEQFPELRFSEFTDAWEQRKLGELVDLLQSYPLSRDIETNEQTGYKYIHYGDIHRGKLSIITSQDILPNIQKGDFTPLQKGDVIVADVSEDYIGIANPCVIDCNLSNFTVAGLHTIAVRPKKIDPIFMFYLLFTDNFKNHGRTVGTGTKVFGITAKNFLNFEYVFPDIKEQTAIGNFFKQLDETIALHQRELEKYKKIKQSYLEKMFV